MCAVCTGFACVRARVCVCSRFKVKWKNRISSHAYIQLARPTRGQFEDQAFFPLFLYTWFFLSTTIFFSPYTVQGAHTLTCIGWNYRRSSVKLVSMWCVVLFRSTSHAIEFHYIYFHPWFYESERSSEVRFLYRIKNGFFMQKQTLLFWPVLVIYIIVCTLCHTTIHWE